MMFGRIRVLLHACSGSYRFWLTLAQVQHYPFGFWCAFISPFFIFPEVSWFGWNIACLAGTAGIMRDPKGAQGSPAVEGINSQTPTGIYSKSRGSKTSNKYQKLYIVVHLAARMDAIFEKLILTLQAASAMGGVMRDLWAQMSSLWEIAENPRNMHIRLIHLKSKIGMKPS